MHLGFKRAAALLCALMLTVAALPAAADANPFHVLLIGVDTQEEDQAGRSDVMLLISLSPEDGSVRMLSFLRDLYVAIPDHGHSRLNAAYFYGGERLLRDTLKSAFGVRVNRYAAVHFSLMAELVDLAGGVEVDVSKKELAQLNEIIRHSNKSAGEAVERELLAAPGRQRLTGKQALSYCRIRKIDSDFQRTSRQQAVLTALFEQVRTLDAPSLIKFVLQALGKVETDLTLQDISALLPMLTEVDVSAIQTARVPFDGAYTDETINGMMVLKPDLKQNQRLIERFLSRQ